MELLRDNLAAGASFSLVGIAVLVLGFAALAQTGRVPAAG